MSRFDRFINWILKIKLVLKVKRVFTATLQSIYTWNFYQPRSGMVMQNCKTGLLLRLLFKLWNWVVVKTFIQLWNFSFYKTGLLLIRFPIVSTFNNLVAIRHVHSAKFSYASISTCERVICYDFRTIFAPGIKGFIYQPKIQIITWNSPFIEDYLALNKEQGT